MEEKIDQYQDKENIIIMSHHLPSFSMVSPRYRNSHIAYAYGNNLDYLLGNNIRFWVAGHSHFSVDIDINGTKCLSNPRGYEGSINPEYDMEKVIEVHI